MTDSLAASVMHAVYGGPRFCARCGKMHWLRERCAGPMLVTLFGVPVQGMPYEIDRDPGDETCR